MWHENYILRTPHWSEVVHFITNSCTVTVNINKMKRVVGWLVFKDLFQFLVSNSHRIHAIRDVVNLNPSCNVSPNLICIHEVAVLQIRTSPCLGLYCIPLSPIHKLLASKSTALLRVSDGGTSTSYLTYFSSRSKPAVSSQEKRQEFF